MADNLPTSSPARKLAANISEVLPAYLREMKRWTAWKFIPPKKEGAKPGKFPRSLTNDSSTWRSLPDALREAQGHAGIGFMMLGVSSIAGIDLDGCVDPTTGVVSKFASGLLAALPDTYAEFSPSGKGIRIFALVPPDAKVPEFTSPQGVECYVGRGARYLTVTGHVLEGREGKIAELTSQALAMLAPFATSGKVTEVEIKLPVPATERLEKWQEIFDRRLPYTKLRKEWRDFLETGDLPGGRSEKAFGIAAKMVECRYLPDDIFAVLVSAPGSWEAALDKRDQDVTRARALIWSDIGRAQKIIRADETGLQERVDSWAGLGLRTVIKGKQVQVEFSQVNVVRILMNHDEWRNRIALDVTTGNVLLDARPLDDYRMFELQEKITAYAGWDPHGNRQWWTDVVRATAEQNPINPRAAELRAMKWDGVARLDTWFTDHVADEDNRLNRILGRKWLIGCVARWINPGCKNDTVLILQGVEGARKNTFFEVIAGHPSRVVPIEGMERDDKFAVAQSWIAEMPEAHILRKADQNRLKGFITRPSDNYRPPYAPRPVDVLRAFVFVSTSNAYELFNSQQDGLRRFWPVWVRKRIDYEWVAEYRSQLLAEAVLAYDLEETWWFDESPNDLRERVEFTVEQTTLDEAVVQMRERQVGKGGLTLTDIMMELGSLLGYRPADRSIAAILYKHGIHRMRRTTHRFWFHPSWRRRDGKSEDADVIPIRQTAQISDPEEVLS